MVYYDYIFIGGSISSLLSSTTLKNKKILIIEKDNYLGGAWRVDTDKYKNIDLVGHLIVPTNNINGKKIIEFFKNLNIELEVIKKDDFFFETENYRSNGKEGDSIICKNGWVSFTNKIINYVKLFNNIEILKNTEILKIDIMKNNILLFSNNNKFICDKVIIPSYCNLNKLYYNNNNIDISYKKIINTHVLLEVIDTSLNISSNFQAFLDKEPVGVFDRISISKITDSNIIISCRISKNYKRFDKIKLELLYLPFLIKKNILNVTSKINDIYYYNYECNYRDPDINRKLLIKSCSQINKFYNSKKIFYLNTVYMGHFLENFVENKLDLL